MHAEDNRISRNNALTAVLGVLITANLALTVNLVDTNTGQTKLAVAPHPVADSIEPEDIQQQFADFIRENPKLVLESVQAYQYDTEMREWEARNQATTERALPYLAQLTDITDAPVVGNPDAPVAIVEFFDYACPACKGHYKESLADFLAQHPEVRLMPKFTPILGYPGSPGYDPDTDMSLLAVKGGQAALLQGKFPAYHDGMMRLDGRITPGAIEKVAEEAGIDMVKFRQDIVSREVAQAIAKHIVYAKEVLGDAPGTPTYIIGGKAVIGQVGHENLQQLVEAAR